MLETKNPEHNFQNLQGLPKNIDDKYYSNKREIKALYSNWFGFEMTLSKKLKLKN